MNLLPEVPSANASVEPLYNIGVVTRMTGISMATLRAWERRYNFPEASRTLGGHRLYSEHDILQLRWVKSRIEEGMQTAQAIQALRLQEASTQETSSTIQPTPAQELPTHLAAPLATAYQDQLYDALIQRDLRAADRLLGEALAVSPPENLILHVIGPTLAAIGEAWERKQINVGIEHLATNYLRQLMIMWMVSGPPPQPIPPIVLACAPNEWHEGSLLMLGALLRRKRWPIAYLGQAVPMADLASLVVDIRPAAVVLVSMTESSVAEMLNWPQWLPEAAATGKPLVCFGGRIFNQQPEWQARMPGVFLGTTIQEGVSNLEKRLKALV